MSQKKEADSYGMPFPRQTFRLDQSERTFQYDDQLPSLPVPSLEETLEKYLQSVKSFVTQEEFIHTQQIVKQFREGIGQQLQLKLLEKSKHERNWMEKWWEEYAYLRNRDPHVPFSNFAGPTPFSRKYWPPQEGTQTHRAAFFSWFILKHWEAMRKETWKVERGSDGTIWSMSQYGRMYNGCKIPGETIDQLRCYFKAESQGTAPSNVLVACRGRYFIFDALDNNGDILTIPELEWQLKRIRQHCDRLPEGSAVGALTTEHRTLWHRAREHLISIHPDNGRHLEDIQKAIFVISLDDSSPVTTSEVAKTSLIGNARSGWFDKSYGFIAYRNGVIGINSDHAPHDGMVNSIVVYFACSSISLSQYKWLGPANVREFPQPKELQFHLDDRINKEISAANQRYQEMRDLVDVVDLKFTGYGRKFIRKHKLHVDAFVHNALQYAYYRLHKKLAPTYETATTRKFYHGRTETVRTCTAESVKWSKAMLDESVSDIQRLNLLLSAINTHVRLMEEAKEGRGCDRHLLGLQILSIENGLPMPGIFLDPTWTKSGGGGNFILSTSFLGNLPVTGCVTPMCRNGYGFFYSVENERVNMCIVTYTADADTSALKLFDSVCQSLIEMKQLLDGNSGSIIKANL